jgi:hypothetical protein
MNPYLMLDIGKLACNILEGVNSKSQTATSVADAIVQILQKAALAYRQETGKPLDPTLILAEATV